MLGRLKTGNYKLSLLLLLTPAVQVLPFPLFSTSAYRTFLSRMSASATDDKEYYRSDGVRVDFDPYAPGMAEKYGLPGSTDPEGFDPYADTVGKIR